MLFTPVASTFRRTHPYAFERFLDDVLRAPQTHSPSLAQDDKTYSVHLDMPGVTREQVQVSIEGAVVRITTTPEAPRQYTGVYELPQEIDVQASSAKLENGVLSLELVKLQPASRAATLSVQ